MSAHTPHAVLKPESATALCEWEAQIALGETCVLQWAQVATDADGTAKGDLTLDDGVSLDTVVTQQYTRVEFWCAERQLRSVVVHRGYSRGRGTSASGPRRPREDSAVLDTVSVLGVYIAPTAVILNGDVLPPQQYTYAADNHTLEVRGLAQHITEAFGLTWTI